MRSASARRSQAVDRCRRSGGSRSRVEIEVERELLAHVAEPVLPALGVLRDVEAAEAGDAARRSARAGPRACGSSSTCRSRSGRGSRRCSPRGMSKLTLVHRGEGAEPARDVADRDRARRSPLMPPVLLLRCAARTRLRATARAAAHRRPRPTTPAQGRAHDRGQLGADPPRRAADVQGGAEQRHVVDFRLTVRSTCAAPTRSAVAHGRRALGSNRDRISARVPTSTRRPLSRKPMRDAYSASSMYGVETTMVRPSWCSSCSIIQNSRRDSGSTPVVGSSSSSRSGSVSSAAASASFCFMPPESAPARRARNGLEADQRRAGRVARRSASSRGTL